MGGRFGKYGHAKHKAQVLKNWPRVKGGTEKREKDLIAEPLYLVHYIEKAGTGTLDMIALCREKGLPEPEFEQRAGQFVVTLWRDWLTDEILAGLDLNKRQVKAIQFLKSEESLSSADFQHLTGASRQTATRDLDDLVQKAVFVRQGKGRGTRYVICRKLPQK